MVYRHPHARAIPLSVTVEAWILLASVIVAVFLIKTDVIVSLIALTGDSYIISSFITGIFFTSVLTTAPAIVALGEIAVHAPAWQVALAGGVGALIGDLLIFRFVRSRFVEYVMRVAFSSHVRRFGATLASGPFWWISPLGGALVIASPLPDEIGLVMLGLSHIRTWQFVPISLCANIFGVYLIALVAQSLAT
ncbi:MAG: hypothetical protein Q8R25_01470 [bacterium]|nr:hypothetical protein [bacterium]